MNDNAKKWNKKYIWLGLLLFLVLVGLTIHNLGYRLKDNLTLGRDGKLNMVIGVPDSSIYIDYDQKIITTLENENVSVPLSPRTHRIIVSSPGYYPWAKQIEVPSEGIVNLSPIYVKQNPDTLEIPKTDPEYLVIRNKIIKSDLPTINAPLTSTSKDSILWTADNAALVNNQTGTTTVIQPDTILKNVAFYKDRSDSIIFSTLNAIDMIEVSKVGTQNFMPIYKGTDPSFITDQNNIIYVLDGEKLLKITL